MGMVHAEYLASTRVFGCAKCKTHLATIDGLISHNFNGQHGRAFLFDSVVNISLGQPADREMMTGMHTVRDIYCSKCSTTLGWRYDRAFVNSEKYKEGKYILERACIADVV